MPKCLHSSAPNHGRLLPYTLVSMMNQSTKPIYRAIGPRCHVWSRSMAKFFGPTPGISIRGDWCTKRTAVAVRQNVTIIGSVAVSNLDKYTRLN